MAGNPTFPKPEPTLAEARAACDKMTAQRAKRDLLRTQAKQATTDLTADEAIYDRIVTAVGAYVETIAQGSAAIIESAGMPASADSGARPGPTKLPAPDGLTATMGDEPGEVDAHWHSVKGARAYEVRYGQAGPDALTQHATVTRSKASLAALVSGKEVWLAVMAVGPDGGSPSQPVRCMVP